MQHNLTLLLLFFWSDLNCTINLAIQMMNKKDLNTIK